MRYIVKIDGAVQIPFIHVLSSFPNSNRVHKRVVPVGPASGRRFDVTTRDICISMTYGERIHFYLVELMLIGYSL